MGCCSSSMPPQAYTLAACTLSTSTLSLVPWYAQCVHPLAQCVQYRPGPYEHESYTMPICMTTYMTTSTLARWGVLSACAEVR